VTALRASNERLRERISVLTERDGVAVDDALHHDLLGIMEDHTQSILDDSNKGSFKELFWQQQMQAAKRKDPRQMKWHPQMIRWCLHLKLTSGGGYTTLRESGLLKLPSERTLRDYTHYIPPCTGFQEGVAEQLREYAKIDQLEEWQKFIVVTFDEMKIKQGLVYQA